MKNKNRLKSIVKVCSNISGITLNFLIWDEDFEEGHSPNTDAHLI